MHGDGLLSGESQLGSATMWSFDKLSSAASNENVLSHKESHHKDSVLTSVSASIWLFKCS